MQGQYIPDLTERFPEGFGGVDLTSKYFYEPKMHEDDLEGLYNYSEEDEENNSYLNELQHYIDNVTNYSNEELQRIVDNIHDSCRSFPDDSTSEVKIDPNSMEQQVLDAIYREWDRREAEKAISTELYFIAWYKDGDTESYEIYQAVDLEDAVDLATASLGDTLIDVAPYEP